MKTAYYNDQGEDDEPQSPGALRFRLTFRDSNAPAASLLLLLSLQLAFDSL